MADRARLFVAFDLPGELVEAVARWQELALDDRRWRAVRRDSLHLTVAFLGSRPSKEIRVITACLEESVKGAAAPGLSLLAAPMGIPRRRARAIGFEGAGEELATVCGRVRDALAAGGFYEPEERPWWPHVTVARRRGNNREPVPDRVLETGASDAILAHLVLYRSETRPEGAIHHPEAEITLDR